MQQARSNDKRSVNMFEKSSFGEIPSLSARQLKESGASIKTAAGTADRPVAREVPRPNISPKVEQAETLAEPQSVEVHELHSNL